MFCAAYVLPRPWVLYFPYVPSLGSLLLPLLPLVPEHHEFNAFRALIVEYALNMSDNRLETQPSQVTAGFSSSSTQVPQYHGERI